MSVALVGWGLDRLVDLAREDGIDELEIQIGVSQVLILIAFMFSFVLAMTAAFVGAPAVGGDLESGVAYAILARPLRRADVLLGRWLGSALVVVAYAVASGLLAIGVAVARVRATARPSRCSRSRSWPAQALVLLTLTLALGSVLPSIAAGAIAVVGFGLGWMAGVLAGVAAALGVDRLSARSPRSSRWLLPSDGLWRGVIYGLEPPLVVLIAAGEAPELANANPFYAATPPPLAFVVWSIVWIGARARRRGLVVRTARPLTRATGSAAVAEAAGHVVVDQADALHERVDDRRADEPEAAPPEVGRQRVRGRRRGRDLAGPRGRRQARRRRRDHRREVRDRTSRTRPAVARKAAALPIVASILAPLRTIPASAIRRARSVASNAATTAGSKPAERRPEGLALAQDRRPRQARPGTTRGRAARTARCRRGPGMPHSSSW